MILADIASGNTTLADWFYLIAVILCGLAAIAAIPRDTTRNSVHSWYPTLGWAGVAFIALGNLVL